MIKIISAMKIQQFCNVAPPPPPPKKGTLPKMHRVCHNIDILKTNKENILIDQHPFPSRRIGEVRPMPENTHQFIIGQTF